MKVKLTDRRILLAGGLAVAIAISGLFLVNNMKLKNNLSAEKVKSEKLLSEKLSLDKTLSHIQKNVAELKSKNTTLDKAIAESNRKIQEKNEEINKLTAQNASVKDLKKKLAELENLKQQMNAEMAELNQSLAKAKAENSKLNEQIASATKANSGLANDNSILKALVSNNYRTEALRGKNERLTVKSRQTNKLLVSFDLPGNVDNDVHFKVLTPQGKELSSKTDLSASIQITENGDALLASSNPSENGGPGTKRVEMTYKPTQKLTKGVYQFNLYNGERFLGSTQLRLK